MLRALFLHLIQLCVLEFRILYSAPVMRDRVHWEARSEGAVSANDQRVLARAALPWWHFAAHELFHVLHVLALVDHLVAFVVALGIEIVEQVIHLGIIIRRQVSDVLIKVLEVSLLGHGRLVDVIVSRDAVVVRNLS